MGFKLLITVLLLSISPLQASDKLVVFIPGSGSSGDRMSDVGYSRVLTWLGMNQYFRVFQKQLKKKKIPSMVCPKTPDRDQRSIEERQEECAEMIAASRFCKKGKLKGKIILFGHSMGGLVARLLAHDPRVKECIHSITTLSTPHRGSVLADYAFEHLYDGSKIDLIRIITKVLGFDPENKRYLLQMKSNHKGYSIDYFRSQTIPKNHRVAYYSFSTSFEKTWFFPLKITGALIRNELLKRGWGSEYFNGDNDGIIPTYSQIYGRHVGHIETTHWEAVCPDVFSKTKGCKRGREIILPHLYSLYSSR
ncbi:MAG: hypothetical protein HN509_08300 [Halobacteriovoraceae bacterium]|nr:hypothetical protein [Halobacteriovoraceae bacterium]MBT5094260.1 hypothetical protein [Halobacteriovoraceae bacterium]